MALSPAMMSTGRTYRGEAPSVPRSHGVHVSAVNRALGIAAGKLSDADADDFPFDRFTETSYPLLPALGVGWEEFRASHYGHDQLIWQPCELHRDGIFGTPDGLLWEDETEDFSCFWECKYSTKKLQGIGSLWMYLKQGLCYCAMSKTSLGRQISRVTYDICFALGDYSRPYKPVGMTTKVEFTLQEIETWWEIVLVASKGVKPE